MTVEIVPQSLAAGYAPGRGEFWRWAGSIAVALAIHTAAVLGLVEWSEPLAGVDRTPSLTVDLVPFVNPITELRDSAPGPLQRQAEAAPHSQPDEDEQPVDQTEYVEVAPDADSVVRKVVGPATQGAAPGVDARDDTAPPPPRPSVEQVASWHRQIAMQIERHKSYPAAARARRQTGIAQLAFTINRRGMVTASRIVRSSSFAALDQETIATVRRAQPFPAPPPNMPGETFDFTIPIRFNIR
jgi:protein TonB